MLTNDTGGSGTLSAILASGPADGILHLNPDGSFTYTPTNNFAGFDAFTYLATDGITTSGVATATIMVTPPGDVFYDNFTRSLNSSNSLYPWIVFDGTGQSSQDNCKVKARTTTTATSAIRWLRL